MIVEIPIIFWTLISSLAVSSAVDVEVGKIMIVEALWGGNRTTGKSPLSGPTPIRGLSTWAAS